MIRFKQHKFQMLRNGNEEDRWTEYQLIFKPKRYEQKLLDELNAFLKDKKGVYDWNLEEVANKGILPKEYTCWCEALGDFLLSTGFEYKGSDSWDKAEIWVRDIV